MQIRTAQHLISHLSVKVPSVGSPAGPGLMSWRAKHAKEEEREQEGKETIKEKEVAKRSKHSALQRMNFSQCIL